MTLKTIYGSCGRRQSNCGGPASRALRQISSVEGRFEFLLHYIQLLRQRQYLGSAMNNRGSMWWGSNFQVCTELLLYLCGPSTQRALLFLLPLSYYSHSCRPPCTAVRKYEALPLCICCNDGIVIDSGDYKHRWVMFRLRFSSAHESGAVPSWSGFREDRRGNTHYICYIIAKPSIAVIASAADHPVPQHRNMILYPFVAAATAVKYVDASIVRRICVVASSVFRHCVRNNQENSMQWRRVPSEPSLSSHPYAL